MIVEMEGGGTKQDPYKIKNIIQLQSVRQELDASYKLVSDIDATNLEPEEFEPIGDHKYPFTGTFDGNNYKIHNLCIKQPEEDNVGLFGYIVEEGHIKNIGLTNSTISGHISVGSLVSRNYGKIESSYAVNVDVSGEVYVGGLAGCNRYGEVKLSYTVDNSVSGDKYTSNLLGYGSRESCFTMSSSDESNILDDADLILSIGNHRISYVIETKNLYLQIEDNKIYSRRYVSPIEMQSLVDKTEVVKMTDTFRSSLVATI